MIINEINTENRKEVNRFINFPLTLYSECEYWVPPLRIDAKGMMNKRKNPFYFNSDASFFIAKGQDEKIIGRIAMLENKPFNERSGTKRAFFYLFDVINDFEVAKALFTKGEEWAITRGLDEIYGPKGFSALNGMGMLTRGFKHRPAFGIPYNFDYYPEFITKLGFIKDRELFSGYFHRDQEVPEKIQIVSRKVQERFNLRVDNFVTKTDLKRMLPHMKDLYNGSLVGTSGNPPLTDKDVRSMANQILRFADPTIIKILMKDNKAIGFLLAYPDISEGLQKTGGKLFPFGFVRLLVEFKKTKWININGAGIIDAYRGLGGTAVLFNEMAKSVKSGNYEYADLIQIGAENEKMRRELRSLGIDFYKSHCMYIKKINA